MCRYASVTYCKRWEKKTQYSFLGLSVPDRVDYQPTLAPKCVNTSQIGFSIVHSQNNISILQLVRHSWKSTVFFSLQSPTAIFPAWSLLQCHGKGGVTAIEVLHHNQSIVLTAGRLQGKVRRWQIIADDKISLEPLDQVLKPSGLSWVGSFLTLNSGEVIAAGFASVSPFALYCSSTVSFVLNDGILDPTEEADNSNTRLTSA